MNFILKYFPEITIKSDPVRKRMSRQLTENLRMLLRRLDDQAKVIQDWDKLEVYLPGEDEQKIQQVVTLLGRVPGIANFAQVSVYPLQDLQTLFEQTLAIWQPKLSGKTFCVRVKRNGQHTFSSTDAERFIGGGLLHHTQAIKVDLHQPDITVKLEIRGAFAYIVAQDYPGLGGFPLGTQEDVLSLMSGGFDSTVASYLSIKRGLKTHFCFFNLGGKAHEISVKEIAYYLWSQFGASHRVKFFTVPFEGVVDDILNNVDPSCMGVVLKRLMLRAANKIAERGQYYALVTGEAVAQVSSQTLPNLAVIDQSSECLVLRPLAFMDKGAIIETCRHIGAEAFAAAVPEYCGVISIRPSAHVKLNRVLIEEQKLSDSCFAEAIQATLMQPIDEVMTASQQSLAQVITLSELPPNAVVIDIRHPDEQCLSPLTLTTPHEILIIPFFRLNTAFPHLTLETSYWLYCAKGVMSQLHAGHLQEAGFTQVGVYRPIN